MKARVEMLRQLQKAAAEQNVNPIAFAYVYMGLGDHDHAGSEDSVDRALVLVLMLALCDQERLPVRLGFEERRSENVRYPDLDRAQALPAEPSTAPSLLIFPQADIKCGSCAAAHGTRLLPIRLGPAIAMAGESGPQRPILPNEPKTEAGSGFWLQNSFAARVGGLAAAEGPRAMRARALKLVESCAAGDLLPAVGLVRRLGLCGEAAAARAA